MALWSTWRRDTGDASIRGGVSEGSAGLIRIILVNTMQLSARIESILAGSGAWECMFHVEQSAFDLLLISSPAGMFHVEHSPRLPSLEPSPLLIGNPIETGSIPPFKIGSFPPQPLFCARKSRLRHFPPKPFSHKWLVILSKAADRTLSTTRPFFPHCKCPHKPDPPDYS